jgi:hypothetical protein
MVRRNIHVAYSVTFAGGRNYHACAYMTEDGNPGLPEHHTFKTGVSKGNSDESADKATRAAVAALLDSYPEAKGAPVFSYGRQSEAIVSAAPVISYHGRNWGIGVAGA